MLPVKLSVAPAGAGASLRPTHRLAKRGLLDRFRTEIPEIFDTPHQAGERTVTTEEGNRSLTSSRESARNRKQQRSYLPPFLPLRVARSVSAATTNRFTPTAVPFRHPERSRGISCR